MEKLSSYFDPPQKPSSKPPSGAAFAEGISILSAQTVLKDYQIALLGLSTGHAKDPYAAAHAIRRKLYTLSCCTKPQQVIDLGNLRAIKETSVESLLAEILSFLLEKKLFVILFGGSHDLDVGQYMAYESLEKEITMLSVDNRIDMSSHTKESPCHLNHIFTHRPDYLFHYIHLAFQSYLVDREVLEALGALQAEAIRLGTIRENLRETETLVRQSELMSFDVAAISQRYAPAGLGSEIFGLSGEEACQLAWYAGMSERMRSVGIYGYTPSAADPHRITAMTLATMIWHLVEGFLLRRHSRDFKPKEYIKYVVDIQAKPAQLLFYKSLFSEKWWMHIPDVKEKYEAHAWVPCGYHDYVTASRGEVPARWSLMHQKMTH